MLHKPVYPHQYPVFIPCVHASYENEYEAVMNEGLSHKLHLGRAEPDKPGELAAQTSIIISLSLVKLSVSVIPL
jgi:hypothetical protein